MKKLFLSAAALVLSLASAAAAQQQPQPPAPPAPSDPHAGHVMPAAAPAKERTAAETYFTDVELVNQDGQKVRFYTDVLKGKTVVVNAFFTTCTGVCPPMNRSFEKIQEAFGDRVGKDVFLVSITVDPENDTPARLKEYAAKYRARPGWTFLTGKKEHLDWALYKLGQYVENKESHKSVVIVGNEATGLWKKAFGLAPADELIGIVESVVNDKGVAAQPATGRAGQR